MMRNLVEYPITWDEKISVMQQMYDRWIQEHLEDMECGDITGVVLLELLQDFKAIAYMEAMQKAGH